MLLVQIRQVVNLGLHTAWRRKGEKCSMWTKAQRRRTGGKWTGFGTIESAAVYAVFSSPMPLHHTLSFEEITFLVAWHKQAESVIARSSSFYVTNAISTRACCLLPIWGIPTDSTAVERAGPVFWGGALATHASCWPSEDPNPKLYIFLKGKRGVGEGEISDKQRQ